MIVILAMVYVVALLYGLVAVLYFAAKNKIFSTFLQMGTLEMIGSGSDEDGRVADYVDTLVNIPGYRKVKKCTMKIPYWIEVPETDLKILEEVHKSNPDTKLFQLSTVQDHTIELEEAVIPYPPPPEIKIIEEAPDPMVDRSRWERVILWLFRNLGLYRGIEQIKYKWISLFGAQRIGSFEIVKSRIKEEKERRGKSILEWVQTDDPEDVEFFIWKSQRPVTVENVELRDGSRCHFLASVTLQFVVPRLPGFIWKHRFYRTIESIIAARIVGWARNRTYAQLLRYEKTDPSSTFFQAALSQLNAIGSKEKEQGLIEAYGVMITQGWIESYQLSEKDQAIHEASQQRELAARKGDASIVASQKAGEAEVALAHKQKEARIIRAEGEREARKIEAEGDRAKVEQIVEGAKGNVDIIVQRLKVDQRTATPALSTLVESDAKTGVNINVPSKSP